MCSTDHSGNGILFIGRSLAYCKTKETGLLRPKWGPVDREGCGIPQNRGNGLVLERYGRNGCPIHWEGCGLPQNGTPRDTVHLHHRLPPRATVHPPSTSSTGSYSSTVDCLHGLLFIHRRPPPASTCDGSSMGSCSSSLQRSSTGYCSTSPLHGVLLNHPSTGYCSSSPPPTTVQPALHGVLFIQPSTGVLFIHPQPA